MKVFLARKFPDVFFLAVPMSPDVLVLDGFVALVVKCDAQVRLTLGADATGTKECEPDTRATFVKVPPLRIQVD
jgi:hypothetical protein